MSALTLKLMDKSSSLDLSVLTPAALHGLTPSALRRLRIPTGGRQRALGELFESSGDDASHLRLVNLHAGCHRVGSGMREGLIEVRGRVGDELGREMRGGELRVSGHAGDGAGIGMAGGHVHIGGSAGRAVGGLAPGATRGMNGGVLVVNGDVGTSCGERMRRGLLVVGGNAGEYLGDRMLAGTIVVFGHTAAHAGMGMRRGTLLLTETPSSVGGNFRECGEFELGVMTLLRQYLAGFHPAFARRLAAFASARRLCGDMAYGGKGEILVAGQA